MNESEEDYRRAIELDPHNARKVYRLALLLHDKLQRVGEAEREYRRAIALAPEEPFFYGGLLSLLVQQSRQAEALDVAARMRELLMSTQHWYGLATVEAILGNTEAALAQLAKAAQANGLDRAWARIDPDLVSIRDDPRFEEIVGKE